MKRNFSVQKSKIEAFLGKKGDSKASKNPLNAENGILRRPKRHWKVQTF